VIGGCLVRLILSASPRPRRRPCATDRRLPCRRRVADRILSAARTGVARLSSTIATSADPFTSVTSKKRPFSQMDSHRLEVVGTHIGAARDDQIAAGSGGHVDPRCRSVPRRARLNSAGAGSCLPTNCTPVRPRIRSPQLPIKRGNRLWRLVLRGRKCSAATKARYAKSNPGLGGRDPVVTANQQAGADQHNE